MADDLAEAVQAFDQRLHASYDRCVEALDESRRLELERKRRPARQIRAAKHELTRDGRNQLPGRMLDILNCHTAARGDQQAYLDGLLDLMRRRGYDEAKIAAVRDLA